METILTVARTLHFAAAVSLTGTFAFTCLVAGPAFRGAGGRFADAVGLRQRLAWLGWASIAMLIVSGTVWLVAVASRMSGRPLGALLSHNVPAIVMLRTRFGEDWLVRLALAAPLVVVLAVGQVRRRPFAAASDWAAFGLSAMILAALAWAGHGGADAGLDGETHLAADILHLLAAGVWLGALVPLALLFADARRAGDRHSMLIARLATSRFSAMAVASVGILLVSGVINTWFLAGSVPSLVGTLYGRLLLLKVVLFAAMLVIAAVNLRRLSPRLADPLDAQATRTIGQLRRNALAEAGLGLGVLAIVGALGTLPPGSHTEPNWPFPFQLDTAALPFAWTIGLTVLAGAVCLCAAAAVASAAAGLHRRAAAASGGLAVCLAVAWLPLRGTIERAYPTSFYAPTEPYAANSVVRGASLYNANCVVCHGASGRGDGPAASALPIRPADLTEPHLFAHNPGDLFWWISHGRHNSAMPGFAGIMSPSQRWDVINFLLARAAGVQTQQAAPHINAAAAYPVPDFAFEKDGTQNTLRRIAKRGPVLLVLFRPPVPAVRLDELASQHRRFAAVGLSIVAINLDPAHATPEGATPLVVHVSPEVAAALALFEPGTANAELMLDRGGNVRGRWVHNEARGPATPETLAADAERVARIPVAAASHAGHAH